jgi:hypothetical protein
MLIAQLPLWGLWHRVHKGDTSAREMADQHYTRQTPGHPMWTRPGYNHVLRADFPHGRAVWCWWRPKWEDGRPGTRRKDRMRVLECTMFRREGNTPLASELILAAVTALRADVAADDLHYDTAGAIKGLLTGIASDKTAARRGREHSAGYCYLCAGWRRIRKRSSRADVWLFLPWRLSQ